MINDAVIRRVKYHPELIPDSWFGNVPLNAEFAPPILDLRRFAPYIVRLVNPMFTANANVELRTRYDELRVNQNTAAMLSNQLGAWELHAKSILYYNFFGVAAVANYTTHYGVWALMPTVAHKLLYDIKLTPDEQAISDELGIKNTVEKGLLPLPIPTQVEREYHILGEETHGRSINIAAANTTYPIEVITPRPNEFLVLTRLASAPAGAANVVQFLVDRDDDVSIADVRTFPLSLVVGGEIPCFIPAVRELRLTTTAAVAPGAHLFRYTIQRVKLTNLLRVRFGLVSQDEVTADLWKKVYGGVV